MNDDDLDRSLDAQLRAAFAPPPAASFAGAAARVARPAGMRRRWQWWLAAAAAALLVWVLAHDRPRLGPEGHDGRELGALWAAAYADAVTRGFGGTGVGGSGVDGGGQGHGGCCVTSFDLGMACQRRFATRLELAAAGDLTVVGSYRGLSTGGCMAVLARYGDEPVSVCVVRAEDDPRVELPADSPLHLARRELGGVVLYALSNAPPRAALDQFVLPEQ